MKQFMIAMPCALALFAAPSAMSFDYASDVAAMSPTSWWRLGESSGLTATDEQGTSHGTYRNTPTYGTTGAISGDSDTAITFSTDYVEIPHHASYLVDNGTISFWFNPGSDITTIQGLFSKDSNGYDTGGHLTAWVEASLITVRLQSTTADYTLQSGTIAASTWQHVVITFGSAGVQLYLDGVLVDTDPYTGGLATTSGGTGNFEPIAVGVRSWTSGDLVVTPVVDYLTGSMDEVIFFPRQVTASEVLTLAQLSGLTYFVRTSGSDSNDGLTPATACGTVDHAAATMIAGDTVYVGAGTYTEAMSTFNSGTAVDPITYIADTSGANTGDAGTVQLTAAASTALTITTANWLQFTGFTMSGSTTAVSATGCSDITFTSCQISNQTGDGAVAANTSATFVSCTFTNNGGDGLSTTGTGTVTATDCTFSMNTAHGVHLEGATATVRRCTCTNNGISGIGVGGTTATIVNCLLTDNSENGLEVFSGNVQAWHLTANNNTNDGVGVDGGTVNVVNSIATNNGDGGLDRDAGTFTHSYNLVWGNLVNYDNTSVGTGEVSSNPAFVGSSDFHLVAGSAAIDSGTNSSSYTAIDLESSSRPDGAGYDMGAYEGGAAASATVYYVRKTGSDSNSGTSAGSAWLTIDKAANTMVAGDIVYVGAGVYQEIVTPTNDGTSGAPIRYYADTDGAQTGDAGVVEIESTGTNAVILNSNDYHEFTGFLMEGGTDSVFDVVSSDGARVTDCEIIGATGDGEGIEVSGGDITVVDCLIHNNLDDAIAIRDGDAVVTGSSLYSNGGDGMNAIFASTILTMSETSVYSNGVTGVRIDNDSTTLTNLFVHHNGDDGICSGPGAGNDTTIWHVTVTYNGNDGVECEGGTMNLHNSIVAHNASSGIEYNAGTYTHTYNIAFDNGNNWDATTPSTGDQTADPQMAGESDYQYLTSSPAKNAGTDGSAQTSIDLVSSARPYGGGWDIGCYEGDGVTLLFTDVTVAMGVNVTSSNGYHYPGAFNWADFDNDGYLDAMLSGNLSSRLLMSNAAGSFLVSTFGGGTQSRQPALLDADNDGDIDIWTNTELLYVNDGAGGFSSGGAMGFTGPLNNEGVAAADLNLDGYADFVMMSENGNWVGLHGGASPTTYTASNDAVYGLHVAGTFGNGDYVSVADVNNDRRPDFFYNYGSGVLFLSEGDGTYYQDNMGISVVTGNDDKFGSAWADYDNDGDMDLFVPRYDGGYSGYLWRNDNSTFTNVTSTAGITDSSAQRAAAWGDYDNDGHLDLYITTTSGDNVLYHNDGDGTFTVASEGVGASGNGQDGVFVDYDNDGDLDLSVSRESDTARLYRNNTDDTNYLKVRVIGAGAGATNAAGIGVRAQLYSSDGSTLLGTREVGGARGYGGTEPLWLHFGGVDKDTTYQLKVYFANGTSTTSVVPSAVSTTIGATVISQMITITEGDPAGMQVVTWDETEH